MAMKRLLQCALCTAAFLAFGLASVNSLAQSTTDDSVAQSSASDTATGLSKLNHIIFFAQENRSFDHYFGEMRQYWADNGYADRSFDGLPQFNPSTGLLPHYGPPPTNPGCDPKYPPPDQCTIDGNSPKVESYQLITQCIENPSPSWNEAHVDWNYYAQTGKEPANLDGFVYTSGHDGRVLDYYDKDGIRAIGYYDGTDLNYYYFMASNFATSDRWFNPGMFRTHPNREYLVAGTSQGDVYPIGTDSGDKDLLTATTIFQELEAKGVSWKIYVNPTNTGCNGPPYEPSCLLQTSYIKYFEWGQTIPTKYPKNIGTIGIANSDFENDLKNNTLPAVVQIEPATDAGFDEHPSSSDSSPNHAQEGAQYVSEIINSVMTSSSWKSTAFIFTYDEFGGLFDHVSPQPAVSPDGIKPKDFLPGDICTTGSGPTCDFVFTGYRVPLIVISPYTKKHYVSHTVADSTAILKLIETRFNLPALTKRDAAQMNMTEFFDFAHPSWMTPPTPPVQNTSAPCYLDKLP